MVATALARWCLVTLGLLSAAALAPAHQLLMSALGA